MTRSAVLALLLASLLAGCGKYGPPVRAAAAGRTASGAPVSGVTDPHPADCEDPEHDHAADASGSGAEPGDDAGGSP